MEKLLHYVWKHRMLPLARLTTTDGRAVEVIDPGMHNADQGPDFFNAKVLVDGVLWAGNVEIHLCASDWMRHRHHADPAYDNTVLHVVRDADCDVYTCSGRKVPQLCLPVPPGLEAGYQTLLHTDEFPRCYRMLPSLPPMRVHSWMDRLLAERMHDRAEQILHRLAAFGGDWERACFVTLCRNFGFGLNGDVFERWATSVPLQALGKHRDHLFQIEAMMLGMAGLIGHAFAPEADADRQRMEQEFAFLAHKFSLTPVLQYADWKYLRTRPQNFPHQRIRQIARLYHAGQVRMDALLAVGDARELHARLQDAGISESSSRLILINTVAPLLYAYAGNMGEQQYADKALALLEHLPAENNHILRTWRECGIRVSTAADSQALIQLKKLYCDRLDCLRCQFGYDYLKQSACADSAKNTQNTDTQTHKSK